MHIPASSNRRAGSDCIASRLANLPRFDFAAEQLSADAVPDEVWCSVRVAYPQSSLRTRETHESVHKDTTWSARGGSRTHTSSTGQGILSPQRLPFRHPGPVAVNLSQQGSYCNTGTATAGCSKASVSVVVSVGLSE